MMKHVRGLGIATSFLLATQAAFALMVPAGIKDIRLGRDYPENAQKQIRTALESENCTVIRGRWINGIFQLEFGGDTPALNGMLKKLADCPGTSVAVSFREAKQQNDWQVDLDTRSMQFRVIVNMNSESIALGTLKIPAAQGPRLETSPTAPK